MVTLREPKAWLTSYKRQMVKTHLPASDDPTSCTYVEPDTWLLDFDGMLAAWRRVLGDEHVIAISYEQVVTEFGSTIPGIMQAFGLDPAIIPGGSDVRLNVTPIPPRFMRLRTLVRRVIPRTP